MSRIVRSYTAIHILTITQSLPYNLPGSLQSRQRKTHSSTNNFIQYNMAERFLAVLSRQIHAFNSWSD
ncbi:hypothetical protein [Phocaeicola sp.]|uniref:hypothetical protein n=1 Tax=Phocaeicola sp. TaxID=2773926 RepID=UPI003A957DCB